MNHVMVLHLYRRWLFGCLTGIGLIALGCQSDPVAVSPALNKSFTLAGQYTITSIHIVPALQSGEDVIAMYADSSGMAPCLSNVVVQFNANGLITFTKPAGCEQNDDFTEATGLHYGDKWTLDTNTLLVDNADQTTQYDVAVDDRQVHLSVGIDKGYTSSLDENDPGFTITISLKRL